MEKTKKILSQDIGSNLFFLLKGKKKRKKMSMWKCKKKITDKKFCSVFQPTRKLIHLLTSVSQFVSPSSSTNIQLIRYGTISSTKKNKNNTQQQQYTLY